MRQKIESDVGVRCEPLERQRVTYRKGLPQFALAAAIALVAVACDGGDGTSGTRRNEAASAKKGAVGSPDPAWVTGFLGPLTDEQDVHNLFEVEADHGEYWRLFTLDRYDGESWTSTDPDGSEGGVRLSVPASLSRSGGGPPPGAET